MLAPTKFPGKQEGSLGGGWKGVKEKVPKKQSFLWALPSSSHSFTSSLCLSVTGSGSSSQTSQVLFRRVDGNYRHPVPGTES